jgi:outer membrane protein assembly factor BamB
MKLSCILVILLSSSVFAEQTALVTYPRWRGEGADGSAKGDYPVKLTDEKNLAWKVELPGKGCSSPAVWGDRIVIATPIEKKDALMAFDFTGKELWRTTIGPAREGKHINGSASNPSPATDGERVFAYFKSGHLAAVGFSGKLLWHVNLQDKFGKDTLFWDIGSSPVLTKKHVIATVMHAGESYLAAYDKATGELAWRELRNYKTPIEGDQSYTTPIIIEHDGKEAILVWGAEHVTAHSAADGKVLWSCGGFNPKGKAFWVSVASAVLVDDMLIVPYGRGEHLAGVKLGGSGDVTATHRTWTRDGIGAFVPTPAAHEGKVYLLSDRGEVTCLDPRTGTTIWKGEFPKAAAKYYASPVVAGSGKDAKVYGTREDGMIFVATADERFELLAENNMGERVIATPVPVAGKLLIRGEKTLFCIEKK